MLPAGLLFPDSIISTSQKPLPSFRHVKKPFLSDSELDRRMVEQTDCTCDSLASHIDRQSNEFYANHLSESFSQQAANFRTFDAHHFDLQSNLVPVTVPPGHFPLATIANPRIHHGWPGFVVPLLKNEPSSHPFSNVSQTTLGRFNAPVRADLHFTYLNERALNERVLNERALNERALNERALNERILNDSRLPDRSLKPQPAHQNRSASSESEYISLKNVPGFQTINFPFGKQFGRSANVFLKAKKSESDGLKSSENPKPPKSISPSSATVSSTEISSIKSLENDLHEPSLCVCFEESLAEPDQQVDRPERPASSEPFKSQKRIDKRIYRRKQSEPVSRSKKELKSFRNVAGSVTSNVTSSGTSETSGAMTTTTTSNTTSITSSVISGVHYGRGKKAKKGKPTPEDEDRKRQKANQQERDRMRILNNELEVLKQEMQKRCVFDLSSSLNSTVTLCLPEHRASKGFGGVSLQLSLKQERCVLSSELSDPNLSDPNLSDQSKELDQSVQSNGRRSSNKVGPPASLATYKTKKLSKIMTLRLASHYIRLLKSHLRR